MYIFWKIFKWTISVSLLIFEILSVVLFIEDGIKAKKEGRSRKTKYTVMFIISMILINISIAFFVFIIFISFSAMRNM